MRILALLVLALGLVLEASASRLLNGSSDVITTPGVSTPIDISTGPMVLSFWIYPTTGDLTGEHGIIAKWADGDDALEQYWIGFGGIGSDAKIGFVIGRWSVLLGIYGQCNLTLVADQWYQVTVLVDPGTTFFGSPAVEMWVASTVGSCSISTAIPFERRTAGGVDQVFGSKFSPVGGTFYGGRLAEVAFWNTLVSGGEVTALSRVCPRKIHPSGLVSYKPLWGASGSLIEPDLAGLTSINGALTGTTAADHAPCTP